MQSSSTARSVIIYTLVALVLGAAIFGGVQVVKNRNSVVATASQKPATSQPAATNPQQPAKQTTPPKTTPTPPAANKPSQVATNTPPKTSNTTTPAPVTPPAQKTPSTPVRVPATGDEDALVATLALMGLVFAGFMYGQSRRRLTALR